MLGERLRAARRRKGWTQEELGEALGGLTKAAISAYETGKRMPDAQIVRLAASKLGLPGPSWLLREPEYPVRWLGFRKRAKLGKQVQYQLQADAELKVEAYLTLQALVEPEQSIDFPEPTEVSSFEEVEEAACALRKQWVSEDAPLPSLTALMEESGALVLDAPAAPDFDGLSGEVETASGMAPVVVVNSNRATERLRLSSAHELGHRYVRLATGAFADEKRPDEAVAFRYGAALLVPANLARAELGRHRTRLELAELVKLKERYGLSIGAWVRRARDLGIITDAESTRWWKYLSQTGLRRTEETRFPYQGDETPSRLVQMLAHALAEGYVSEDWARRRLPDVLTKLATVEEHQESQSLARQLRRATAEERRAKLLAAAEEMADAYEEDPDLNAFAALEGEPFDEVE